ncbi:MAG: nucleotidyltransferase domain-containing protein [Candidatus Electryonea clarkiae]|nr:nucleotidyltransferase domain-containing protein [Candidatus Electryonea clarkiae]MDP8287276.1 nucleotidyltransferase domain-containing protein [Candidatus Electryonea clarkiae]
MSTELINEIIDRILKVTQPARIIHFGSSAEGKSGKDSDIDLLIIHDEIFDNRRERVMISNALRGIGHPVDIMLIASERFEETKNIIGGIAYPANKYGRIVYEAA